MFLFHIQQIIFRPFRYFIVKIAIKNIFNYTFRINSRNIIIWVSNSKFWYLISWISIRKFLNRIFNAFMRISYILINAPTPFILVFTSIFITYQNGTFSSFLSSAKLSKLLSVAASFKADNPTKPAITSVTYFFWPSCVS